MKKTAKRIVAVVLTVVMLVGLLAMGAGAATHTVAPGENLSALAQKYLGDRTKWREIYNLNKDLIKDPNVIYVGQVLNVPGEEEPVAPVVEEEATTNAVVKTTEGWYIGTKELGVYTFKGMKYGVADRFKEAVRPSPFPGLHAATIYGNTSPTSAQSAYGSTINVTNYMTPNANFTEDEDCLHINVWSTSMNPTAEMPVLFWIHGGGTSSGASNELTYYDGLEFAKSQDVVFVSINHRLNYLGYLDLSAYEGFTSNLGQKDIVLALEWVRDNIAQFGGDPNNVTIMGQSGGGTKVSALLTCAPAQGLFHKAAQFSGGGAITMTSEKSQAAGVAVVEKVKEGEGFATDAEALEWMCTAEYGEVYAYAGGGNGPTIDGEFIVASPIDENGNWHEMTNNIPMMITTAYAEMSGAIDDNTIPALIDNSTDYNPMMHGVAQDVWPTLHNKAYMTEESKDAELTKKYGDLKDDILAAFAKAYPELEPYDVTRINIRDNSKVTGRAKSCTAPTYQAVWAYEFPAFGGQMAWHTGGDIPFVFNNMKYIENLIAGDSANAWKLAELSATMMGNFCKYGDPSTDELAWPAFTVENGATMIFNNDGGVVRNYHDVELMDLLKQIPSSGMPF